LDRPDLTSFPESLWISQIQQLLWARTCPTFRDWIEWYNWMSAYEHCRPIPAVRS